MVGPLVGGVIGAVVYDVGIRNVLIARTAPNPTWRRAPTSWTEVRRGACGRA